MQASSNPPDCEPASWYLISATDLEKQRLSRQYDYKKVVYGWTSALPASIDISRIHTVLDVAAGTCVWAVDLARDARVRARLGTDAQQQDSLRISACDIDPNFFPERGSLDELGIETFQHDITTPFPLALLGKFDLIHISLLLLSLTKHGWESALRHCADALNVGGILLLDDVDAFVYNNHFPPPAPNATSHDIARSLSAPGWVGDAHRILAKYVLKNGRVPDLSFRLPSMISSAGLHVVDYKRANAPVGRLCRTWHTSNIDNGNLEEYEEFSVENLMFLFRYLAAALFAEGELCAADGGMITTESEMVAMLERVEAGLRIDGGLNVVACVVAEKRGE
ncbi:hypothetical protein C8Q80DRAFT_1152365 [Daedaleopsis nitida]|nr:hypothetical protein C8Q80DRAFT_1152365 [Daedaleopsis nitida]